MSNSTLNLTTETFIVSREQKETLNGHSAITLWLTGLSASGKSTIARLLEEKLYKQAIRTIILDGDNTRLGINKDLDFSPEGRTENIRRVAEIAKLMNDAGVVVIACFISPLIADRQMAKQIIGSDSFFEVFIDASLEVCIQRDPKGLYKKAVSGEIREFTGISAPYESPTNADIKIKTAEHNPIESANELLNWLQLKTLLSL
jgi:adenylyl-sulfate kinase